jgi:hypothetical protein
MGLYRGAKTSKRGQPRIGHAIDREGKRRDTAPGDNHRSAGPEFRNTALHRHVLGLAEQTRVAARLLADVTASVTTHRIPLLFARTHGPSLLAPLQKQPNVPFCSLNGHSRPMRHLKFGSNLFHFHDAMKARNGY